MKVRVGLDQHKCPLANIDLIHVLLRLHVCKLLDYILPPIYGDLVPNEKILLLDCLVPYPSEVYFAISAQATTGSSDFL